MGKVTDFVKATRDYERRLAAFLKLLPEDLERKHELMASEPFAFFRATYYRWAELWTGVCGDAARGPKVLAVGDIHLENFGTWRDSEGRLAWGINDFDECDRLPYTVDLIRLAASAIVARQNREIRLNASESCDAILDGYKSSLEAGGDPFVLAEQHEWLRKLAMSSLRDPVRFWSKLTSWPEVKKVPDSVRRLLERMLPQGTECRIVHRQAGLGSLGRRRFTAIGEWKGGLLARESKELAPPATGWAEGRDDAAIEYNEAIEHAVRAPDPSMREVKGWIYRRLAPDCSRVEMASIKEHQEQAQLLRAMGWEVANVHLGSRRAAKRVLEDLDKRPGKWLKEAASAMTDRLAQDFEAWRKHRHGDAAAAGRP